MKTIKLDALLAKPEAVYGTDAVPVAGTDGVQLDEHLWANIEVDYLERNERADAHAGGRMGPGGTTTPAGRWVRVRLAGVFKGKAGVYAGDDRPEMDALLRGCGHAAAAMVGPPTGVRYTPADTGHESVTLYAFAAGLRFKIVGARGSMQTDFTAAKLGSFRMEFRGLLAADPEEVALPAVTYPRLAVRPPAVSAAALTLNGVGISYKALTFDQGAEISEAPRGGAPDGHAGYEITDMQPKATVTWDRPTLAAINPWAMERQGTEFAWSLELGSAAGNRIAFRSARTQIAKNPPAEDKGFAMLRSELALYADAANPLYAIEFT